MRIIQDSEDEDDLDVDDAGAAAECDAPPERSSSTASPQPGEKGTGSTESLKRAIEAAHHAQFRTDASSDRQDQSEPSRVPSAPNPSAPSISQDALNSSTPVSGHASKRRKTSLDGFSVALSSVHDRTAIAHEQTTVFNTASIEQPDGNTNAQSRPWDLQGTLRDVWHEHEPMGLFLQPSSTIPNATATQQQLLAEVLAPGFLGVESELDAPKYEPSKSSVPWSEYLRSSSKASQDRSQPAEQPLRLSQTSQRDTLTQLRGNPSHNEVTPNSIDPAEILPRSLVPEQPISNKNAAHKGANSGKANQKFSSEPNSEDDLLGINLLMEQYKPRPSRSRSLRLSVEEKIDYSKRPEQALKKTRRTRTTGDIETASSSTTPEKVQQICDMGFTPVTTKKALRQHNGDVGHTVDWLIANGLADEDELAPPRPSKSKSRRLSKGDEITQDALIETFKSRPTERDIENLRAPIEPSHSPIPDDIPEPAVTVMKSPTIVKVVIPKLKKHKPPSELEEQQATEVGPPEHVLENATSKSAKRKKIIEEPEPTIEDHQDATTQAPKEKKRGRGRPKKEAKPIEAIVEEPLEDRPPEPDEPALTENIPGDLKVSSVEKPQCILPPSPTTPAPTAEKRAKPANGTPSTTSKGKTPYRVGLSKRARIAPLLRVVKK